jgi:hypothetical protein
MNQTLTMYPARFAVLFLRLWKYLEPNRKPDELDENARKHWRLWLLPEVVSYIEPDTHYELTDEQRRALAGHIQSYRAIAERAGTTPPTESDLRQARDTLLAVYRAVPYFLTGRLPMDELSVIDRALTHPTARKWVVCYAFKSGRDWSGDEAVWVWVIVEDGVPDDPAWEADWQVIQSEMARAIDGATGGRVLVYSLLRVVSEQQELVAGNWE